MISGALPSCVGGWGRVLLQGRCSRLVDRPRVGGCRSSLRRAVGGMVCCDRIAVGEINQTGRSRRAGSGVMTATIRAHRGSARPAHAAAAVRAGGQAADVAVAQPVEHQRGQLAGGGDDADVAAAALADPVADAARGGCAPGTRCTASTAAQRTSREPCLVIRPRCTVVSDSWCFGVSPAQEASCAGRWKRVMSPISATNTAASTGPTPGICWIAW